MFWEPLAVRKERNASIVNTKCIRGFIKPLPGREKIINCFDFYAKALV